MAERAENRNYPEDSNPVANAARIELAAEFLRFQLGGDDRAKRYNEWVVQQIAEILEGRLTFTGEDLKISA